MIEGALRQLELFHRSRLPGLAQAEEFVTPEQERALTRTIDASGLMPFQFHGWEGKRLSASFGWRYDFSKEKAERATPIPEWLLPARESAARFAGLQADDLVQALLLRYDPGAGIGWHRDKSVFEHVIGISLGSPATMRFRRRTAEGFDRIAVPMQPRSIYHLSGDARNLWEHSIAPLQVTRWSITFRSLSKKSP